MELSAGGNTPVPATRLQIRVSTGKSADVSAFRLYANGKVQGDSDMVFYGQTRTDDGTISMTTEGQAAVFDINLPGLNAAVQKVAFTVTCEAAGQTVSALAPLSIQVVENGTTLVTANVDAGGRSEAALIMGELYRRNQDWKFRFVSQGFNGGLKPLAENFGVEVADDEPAPSTPAALSTPAPAPAAAPAPTPSTPVNLSKVSLTKEKPKVSLAKKEDFGEIRINLNWNKKPEKKGFLSGLMNGNIDLDLGAFIETQDGQKGVIQALGGSFGSFTSPPFVLLKGDDRTGASVDGEWMHINGRQWNTIREVLIYAFIYEGVPNWDGTDGVATVHIPDQPPIETRLTDGTSANLCAIARLYNNNGAIEIERINRFFKGQKELDEAFGWGFRWSRGSK